MEGRLSIFLRWGLVLAVLGISCRQFFVSDAAAIPAPAVQNRTVSMARTHASLSAWVRSVPFLIDQIPIYYHGITLEEAVRFDREIQRQAQEVTRMAYRDDARDKAYRIYQWITQHIEYAAPPHPENAGATSAFCNRKGLCFDKAALFTAMCRSIGISCRLVTGLGYNGSTWEDHAWNSVWIPETGKWIDLDVTFGAYALYFDTPVMEKDHLYGYIQGEWR